MVAVLSCTVTTVRPTNDTRPLLTRDGSYTVRNDALDVFYHSVHGAIQESTHVFIKAGLEQVPSAPPVRAHKAGPPWAGPHKVARVPQRACGPQRQVSSTVQTRIGEKPLRRRE